MKKNINKEIALMIMVFLFLEFLEIDKRKEHIHINEFPQDTFLRTYATSVASITASAIDLESISTIQK